MKMSDEISLFFEMYQRAMEALIEARDDMARSSKDSDAFYERWGTHMANALESVEDREGSDALFYDVLVQAGRDFLLHEAQIRERC